MLFWGIIAFVWLLGAVATAGVTSALGQVNPHTYYDSFSGDDMLDLAVVIAWPVFWPCFAVYRLAGALVDIVVRA